MCHTEVATLCLAALVRGLAKITGHLGQCDGALVGGLLHQMTEWLLITLVSALIIVDVTDQILQESLIDKVTEFNIDTLKVLVAAHDGAFDLLLRSDFVIVDFRLGCLLHCSLGRCLLLLGGGHEGIVVSD